MIYDIISLQAHCGGSTNLPPHYIRIKLVLYEALIHATLSCSAWHALITLAHLRQRVLAMLVNAVSLRRS